MPGLLWLLGVGQDAVVLGGIAGAIVLVKHQSNIRRLLSGEELKM